MAHITASAQVSGSLHIWDVPLTEILIAQNKTGHADHLELRNNQLASGVTVSIWKQRQDEFKQLTERIDQRLSSVFIVLADVTLVYEVSRSFEEMIGQQQKTLQLLVRHPYAAPLVIQEQERIIRDALDLFGFVQLMVGGCRQAPVRENYRGKARAGLTSILPPSPVRWKQRPRQGAGDGC
jgi:hypothetical protein